MSDFTAPQHDKNTALATNDSQESLQLISDTSRSVAVITPSPHLLRWAAPGDPAAVSALDLSLRSSRLRDLASSSTLPRELPETRSRARKPLAAVIFTRRNSDDEDAGILVEDEDFNADENLGLIIHDENRLDSNFCQGITRTRPPKWIASSSPAIAQTHMRSTDADNNIHVGTAFHIGECYFLTAAHVLRYPGLTIFQDSGKRSLLDPASLDQFLLRTKTGTDAHLLAGHENVILMKFSIVAYSAAIEAHISTMPEYYRRLQSHFTAHGYRGRLPLPVDYVVPEDADIALIRVIKEHRSRVKSAFLYPCKPREKLTQPLTWLGINRGIDAATWQVFYQSKLRESRLFVNQEVLRHGHVAYRTCEPDLVRHDRNRSFMQFHSAKGSSGSPVILPTPKSQGAGRVCGILTHTSTPEQTQLERQGALLRDWTAPALQHFVLREVVPRFRRTGNRLERIIFSRLNKIGAAWQEAVRE